MAPYKSNPGPVDNPQLGYSLHRDIFQRYNDDQNSIFSRSYATKNRLDSGTWAPRQPSKTSESGPDSPTPEGNTASTPAPVCSPPAAPAPPAPPAPPPPPPPTLNGCTIPAIRLKSEIPDRGEPPAKLQTAMAKDKKPFTYTPGGIDLSEIKSPRMQRRIIRNQQTPEDIVLPPTAATPAKPNSLPPSAIAAMTPQIAVSVFPQNSQPLKKYNSGNPPPPPQPKTAPSPPSASKPDTPHLSPAQKQIVPPPPPPQQSPNPPPAPKQSIQPPPPPQRSSSPVPTTTAQQNPTVQRVIVNKAPPEPVVVTVNKTGGKDKPVPQSTGDNKAISRVGTLYIPPVSNADSATKPNSFPVLREAPTPWLQKHQQQPENVPAWVNKTSNENEKNEVKEKVYERKARAPPAQSQKETRNETANSGGARVIPIQIEGTNEVIHQQNQQRTAQRWGNNTGGDYNQNVQSHDNSRNASNGNDKGYSKPVQSRAFKVIQKITGSDDDSTDCNSNIPYNTEGVPLSQLRKLHLNDDDQAFMSRVKAQVDEDTFLHMETDPRYRGSVIPSRAFRMLQNMTDSGQVTGTNNTNNVPVNHTHVYNHYPTTTAANQTNPNTRTQEMPNATVNDSEADRPTAKKYIPPSERQAEQELRKYMGSSIPSRSFRMLQAMTATQDTTESMLCEKTDKIEEGSHTPCNIPSYPNPWPSPPHTPHDVYVLWQHYTYLYNLVTRSPSRFGAHSTHRSPTPSPIEIIITDDDDVDGATSRLVSRPQTEVECRSATANELIITEVVKSNSEHDVSLTVCLPLRRKSKTSDDFHEEITLTRIGNANTRPPTPPEERSPSDLIASPHNQDADDRCDADSVSSDSTSASVDFWKEIVDNEDDLLHGKRFRSECRTEDEQVEPARPASEATSRWRIGDDVKNIASYTSMSDDTSSSHDSSADSEDSKDGCTTDTGSSDTSEDDDNEDDKSESSDDDDNDDYYNVYEFSTHTRSKYVADETPTADGASLEQLDPVEQTPLLHPDSDFLADEHQTEPKQHLQLPVGHRADTSDLEDDSGMTSDIGKYVSETDAEPEPGSELRKLSKYERAATHSRLYKLLLKEETQTHGTDVEPPCITSRRESLTLPLATCSGESVSSSSGINSPVSPVVNERLVGELVQSLLKWKKGAAFRNLSPEKLREAAIRSLQTETAGTSRASTPHGGAAHRGGDDSLYYPGFDICPSRTFKSAW